MTLPRYGRNGDWEKALALLEEMQTDGVRPDAVTYGTIVAAVRVQLARSVRVGTPDRAVADAVHSSFFVILFALSALCNQVHRFLKGLRMGTLGCLRPYCKSAWTFFLCPRIVLPPMPLNNHSLPPCRI